MLWLNPGADNLAGQRRLQPVASGYCPILSLIVNSYSPVLVTDRRILLLDSGKWSLGKPKSITAEFPRQIKLGPPSGLWWKCTALGDSKVYVHKRFHKDVEAADAAIGM